MKKFLGILSLVLLAGINQANAAAAGGAGGGEVGDPVTDRGYGTWKPLNIGDKVYLIAPANGVSPEEITIARDNLAKFGLVAKWDEEAFTHKDPTCPERAMDPATAFKDLMKAFHDTNTQAIWAIRGGRLSCELWDHLDGLSPAEIAALPRKPFLGFSDATSLHLRFNAWGIPTVHTLVALFGKESPKQPVNKLTSFAPTIDILMGRRPVIEYTGFEAVNSSAKDLSTKVSAPLMGGNLSSLHYYESVYRTAAPSIWMIETTDDATRVDSILYALRRSHLFDSAKAIVFGNLHGVSVDDDAKHSAAEARYPMIVSRFAEKVSVPVFVVKGPFDFGHSDWNLPFSLGTLADLIPGASVDTTKLRIAAS